MSRQLVRKLSSARPSVRRRAAADLAALTRTAASASAVAAKAAAADVLRDTLATIKTVTDGVKVPNGTTKRIARIAADGLAAV